MSSMPKKIYACIECGYETSKWMGKCIRCGKWGTLKEIRKDNLEKGVRNVDLLTVENLYNKHSTKKSMSRIKTNFKEFDRVLGGGLVNGEVILLGGEPGVGKTTLLLQVLNNLKEKGKSCVYISAEESVDQLSTHAERLNVSSNIKVICDNNIDAILATLKEKKFDLIVVDSVQTIQTKDMQGLVGGVGQVKECTSRIVDYAKKRSVPIILVGHINKGGDIAGPKVIEHLVDAVLFLEGDSSLDIRFIKSLKNRFGSTREVGVFNFGQGGFKDINNPAEIFLQSNEPRIGVCKGITYEGRRAILVEVQALITKSNLNVPCRVVKGISKAKIQMLCALLTKYTKANLLNKDVYVNIANGLKVKDDSLDLSIVIALLSSFKNKEVKPLRIAIGEVSLTGKTIYTDSIREKVKVIIDLGYEEVIVPTKVRSVFRNIKKVKCVDSIKEVEEIL